MQLEPITAIQTWASTVGISFEDVDIEEGRIQHSLAFRSPSTQDRYWETPWETERLLVLVTALIESTSPWEFCWALKMEGAWDDAGDSEGLDRVLRTLDIPYGFEGAIRFHYSERGALAMLMVGQIAYGWCGYYDIWVVPDHGKQMIRTDDDDITVVFFADETTLKQTIEHLAKAGFNLPNEPPSEGFYWQPWMGPEPPDWPAKRE